MLPERAAVLIVGAGPTGLMLAVELQRRGVDTLLIDLHGQPLTWDRATVVHPRSLELFDALGLVDSVLAEGVRQRVVHLHSDGGELGSLDLALSGSRYPFNLGVSEEVTERVLTRRLTELGGRVERDAKLVALDAREPGPADRREESKVVATIEQHGSTSAVAASWVVGCDGFHGITRRLVGIDEEVRDADRKWVVFDATLEPWDVDDVDTHACFDEPLVIATALPQRRWRIYVHTEDVGADAVESALRVLRRYQPHLRFVDIANVSAFVCHTRIATRYRTGRVMLAGDAAHVCSPAQGHGMNSGLQDAQNLGWKLALVVHGVATEGLLDSYEAERRPIAELYLQEGAASEAIVTPQNRTEKLVRNAALHDRLSNPETRHLEIVAEAELDADLRASPILQGEQERAVAAGDLLPQNITVTRADGTREVLTRLAIDDQHTVALVAGPRVERADLESILEKLAEAIADSAITGGVVAVLDDHHARALGPMLQGVQLVTIGPPDLSKLDIAPDQIVLLAVRPDGWIGVRADSDHLGELNRYENRLLSA